jgi:RHS repeat-associated protein
LIFIQQELIIFTLMMREIEDHSESMVEQKPGGYSLRYRFTGKELDPLIGLYDFGARYYDPRLSVWFGVDPLAEKAPG